MKNKLDLVNFAKIMEMFGEEAARDTLKDVNEGRISEKTLEKHLYKDETKDEYTKKLRKSFQDLD